MAACRLPSSTSGRAVRKTYRGVGSDRARGARLSRPDDDRFLEAALNGRADVIKAGDRGLLVLNPFMNIAILTPAAYLAR
jgi:predicted nucleic acid-binding protein